MAITDPFNAANAQTCNYSYDDLARIAGVDCGTTKWQQNFSYDPFGNITKTVPTGGTGTSFQPTYNTSTNRYTSVPGFTPTYDANGNLTSDSFHTYTWDAEGHPVTVGGTSLTLVFDALGREVEEQNSGVNSEYVYALGKKIALMNGQTQSSAYVPLPGDTQVKYAGTTISTYRVLDWLGSPRVGSNPNRSYSWGLAYAPFGERYASSGSPMWSFTGANADTASDMYDFQFRELHNSQARWISPDPAGPAAVDITDPQTWNRYAYVANRPLSAVDPTGLKNCPECVFLGPVFGGAGCVLDNVNTPCGIVNAVIQTGGANGSVSSGGQSVAVNLVPNGMGGYQVWVPGGCVSATDSSGQGTDPSCTPGAFMSLQDLATLLGGLGTTDVTQPPPTTRTPVVTTLPPSKQPSRKYSDYLKCLGSELIDETVGDDESAFAFTLANIAPFVSRSLQKGNPLYYVGFAVLYDASLGFRARQTCSQQVYGVQ